MGSIKPFPKAKLIAGILISDTSLTERLYQSLSGDFGQIDYTSEQIPFTFSPYYDAEMGTPIFKFFISFKDLIDPAELSRVKMRTNKIENSFRDNENRKINIDPGIMFLSRFILASTKASVQRIPLDSGIYGEITLVYEKKTFRPVEWTYPDYRTDTYITIMNTIRTIYKQQL